MAELELKEVSYFYESGGKRIDILDKASYSFEKGTLHDCWSFWIGENNDADFGGCAGRT